MPISTFARFSHCGRHLMIIMWKDQLFTRRVSDLNEWNAENIERKSNYMREEKSCFSWVEGKETISFVAEWIHLFLRLPSFLCFHFFPVLHPETISIYENAKCSFAPAIINCCVVNYNLELRGKLKAERKILLCFRRPWVLHLRRLPARQHSKASEKYHLT